MDMDAFNKKDHKLIQKCPNVGNSWIICNSKSYPGHVYYFNTLSGEAAWNLSAPEVERAKQTTLESEHKLRDTEFPEPLESPQNHICKQSEVSCLKTNGPSKVYNKQIINNQFTRPPVIPSSSFNPYTFNTLNPVSFGIPAFTPVMNIPGNSIILAPPLNTLQQNIDTNKFECMQESQTYHTPRTLNNRKIFKRQNLTLETLDLRQKLLNIRKQKQIYARPGEFSGIEELSSSLFKKKPEDIDGVGIEHIEGTEFNDTTDDLTMELIQDCDVESLKKSFGINSQSEHWFIVADARVLLNHTNLIIKILESDEQCRLVIPQAVIIQIQRSTTSLDNKDSLRAALFISEALKSNVAIVDDDGATDELYENIFNTCLRLLNQNCDLVLILKKDMPNNNFDFPIFTINDIRKVLIETKLKEAESITITIPNDSEESNVAALDFEKEKLSLSVYKSDNYIRGSSSLPTKDMSVQTDTTCTTEVGVQVDVTSNNITGDGNGRINRNKWIRRKTSSALSNTDDVVNDSFTVKVNVVDVSTSTRVDNDNVMFQITSQSMADYLKLKLDEWVSRFIQIMEEALTQILQNNCSSLNCMAPPWTVYEAAESIKRKFSYDIDVLDAATKLSDILFDVGGARGKLNNIDPETYMKMYSYGYYLIDALQSLIQNDEDLQIAGTSLTKLLSDIQNPYLDPSNCDSFTDIENAHQNYTVRDTLNNETKHNLSKIAHNEPNVPNNDTPKESTVNKAEIENKQMIQDDFSEDKTHYPDIIMNVSFNKSKSNSNVNVTPRKYNLRNRLQSPEKKKSNEIILKHLSLKDTFLTNLELTNNNDSSDGGSDLINVTNGHTFNAPVEGPKILRNFTVCPEFEQRLNKSAMFSEENSEEQGSYCEHVDESVTSEMQDENKEENINKVPEAIDEEDVDRIELRDNLRSFLDEVGIKVKESLLSVYTFCENSRKKLLTTIDDEQKAEMRSKAMKMRTFMENMKMSLKRISERDVNDSLGITHEMLKRIGFHDEDIDEKELEYYRGFISRCLVQGEILEESVKLLIEATWENK